MIQFIAIGYSKKKTSTRFSHCYREFLFRVIGSIYIPCIQKHKDNWNKKQKLGKMQNTFTARKPRECFQFRVLWQELVYGPIVEDNFKRFKTEAARCLYSVKLCKFYLRYCIYTPLHQL